MTCIIGLKHEDKVYIGYDSLGSNGYSGNIRKDRKAFKLKDNNEAIIGFTSSYRMGQLLMYSDELINKEEEINHEYMVTKFIPKIIDIFKGGKYSRNDNGEESGGIFLLAHKNNLFKIESDFQVAEYMDKYLACGCGEDFALGSLYTTEKINMSPIERIHVALQVASKHSVGVAPPFYIINTKNDEIIEFRD